MNNLSIKQKLNFLLLLPFIGLLIFTTTSTVNRLDKINKLEIYLNELSYSKKYYKLINYIIEERALSVIYMNHNTSKNFSLLVIQQKKIDQLILSINKYQKHVYSFSQDLKDTRNNLNNYMPSSNDIIMLYTQIIAKSLAELSKLIHTSNNDNLSRESESLLSLIKAIINAQVEMAHVNSIFLTSKFSANEFTKLQSYKSQYNLSYKRFLQYSSPKIRKMALIQMEKNLNEDLIKYESLIYNKIFKDELIVKIKDTLGYGGLIDDFRTFVINGDLQYKEKYLIGYEKLVKLIKKYKTYETTHEERNLLKTIIHVFRSYKFELGRIESYHSEKFVSKVIPLKNLVDIVDFPAKVALNRLSTSIVGVDSSIWYSLSLNKLNNLNIITLDVFENLFKHSKELKNDLTNQSIIEIISILTLILMVFILSLFMVKTIIKKLKTLEDGLISYFDYVLRKKSSFDKINVTGTDEISQMQVVINKNMQQTFLFIEEEIKIASQKETTLQNQSKMVQMGEMIANIAHQWRQPLTAISVSASGMLVKKEFSTLNDEDFYKSCEEIINQTDYLSSTINTFKDFIKGNKEKKNFLVQEEVRRAIDIVQAILKSHHIELINLMDSKSKFQINSVTGELPQVIINILNNAKDILIDKKIKEPKIIIDCKKNNTNIIISIEDNAGGVPNEIINKIFDPYFTTKHQSQGTGLGLNMSYNIVKDSLKGKLNVTNTSKGAKFIISLPIS